MNQLESFQTSEPKFLLGERRTLGQPGLTASGLAQNTCARGADDDGLRMREDGSDSKAAYTNELV